LKITGGRSAALERRGTTWAGSRPTLRGQPRDQQDAGGTSRCHSRVGSAPSVDAAGHFSFSRGTARGVPDDAGAPAGLRIGRRLSGGGARWRRTARSGGTGCTGHDERAGTNPALRLVRLASAPEPTRRRGRPRRSSRPADVKRPTASVLQLVWRHGELPRVRRMALPAPSRLC